MQQVLKKKGGGEGGCEPQAKPPCLTDPEFERRHCPGCPAPQVFDQLPIALGYVTLHADGVVPAQGAHRLKGSPRQQAPQAPVNKQNKTAVFHLMARH